MNDDKFSDFLRFIMIIMVLIIQFLVIATLLKDLWR